jgi:hypothetical protein
MLNDRRDTSSVITEVIMIAVGITINIAVMLGMTGLIGGFMGYPKLVVKVDVKIYSAYHNIGVLNEDGVFDITIRNPYNSTKKINVIIEAEGFVLYNESIVIEPSSFKNLTINQRLIYLGLWTIRLVEGGKLIYGYSFMTVLNRSEADIRIRQLDDINRNFAISIVALVISALSLAINIFNFILKSRRKKQQY